jgi:uncharacterized repeat protein (TIGR02543 family)
MDLRRPFVLSLLVLGLSLAATVPAQGVTRTLTVTNAGGGTVTSSPAGINCGSDCTETYEFDPPAFPAVHVTLTATPDVGMIFTGWSGACSGTGTCGVTMSQNRSVTATFAVATFDLTVSRAGAGTGTVTSSPAGIDCGSDSSESYNYNTMVTLTATPATGSVFDGWSGACTGTGACIVTMTQARSVTATFSIANFELTVSLAGAGSGSVSSSPAGIDCGLDCSESYPYNTVVTLTATPATGSVFDGWSGDCTGTDPCNVTMDQARSVTATFSVANFDLTVSLSGAGTGTVTSSPAGIDCGSDCSESYPFNTVVTLTATPATGSVFDGWSGDCTGTDPCNVTMDQARSVTATFSVATFELTVDLAGPGSGSVDSSPAGIDCGSDCTETYDYNTEVTLTATPDTGSVLGAWGGDCTGTGECVVTMDQARSVTATFEVGSFVLSVAKDGTGDGTVTSSPAGVDCGSDCSESYAYNTMVTLTATPDVESGFVGWSGACTGTDPCVVTMSESRSVTATFNRLAGINFYPVTPCRVYDTRPSTPMSSNAPILINVGGSCGVPLTAKAVVVNVTAISPPGAGFIVLYAGDSPAPVAVTITFRELLTRTNNAIVALDSNGDGTMAAKAVFGGGPSLHMAVDVFGYLDE